MLEKIKSYLQFIEDKTDIFNRHNTRYFSLSNTEMTKKYPNLYKEIAFWYFKVFKKKPDIKNCSLLLEFFAELKNLKITQVMNALQIEHKLKEGKVAKIGSDYFAKGNPKLTNEICQSIYNKYGADYFEYFDKDWQSKKHVDFKGHQDIKITKDTIEDFFDIKPKEEKIEVKEEKPEEKPEIITPKKPRKKRKNKK